MDLIFQGSDLIRQLSRLLCGAGVGVDTDAVTVSWGEEMEDWARAVPRDGEEEMDFQRMWLLRLDGERERGEASVTAGFWLGQDARRGLLMVPLTRQDWGECAIFLRGGCRWRHEEGRGKLIES